MEAADVMPQVGAMMRPWFKCLVCCLIGMALTLSAASAASARLVMAAQGLGMTEMVICGENGAQVVRLDAAGHPVPATDPADCATCPDCLLSAGYAPPAAQMAAPVLLIRDRDLPVTSACHSPARAPSAVQARAPPIKGI